MIFLDLEDLLHVAERATGGSVGVRDIGLLESAAARPRASAFGADAYATPHDKAAALVHSILRNHALVDGNKRLGRRPDRPAADSGQREHLTIPRAAARMHGPAAPRGSAGTWSTTAARARPRPKASGSERAAHGHAEPDELLGLLLQGGACHESVA